MQTSTARKVLGFGVSRYLVMFFGVLLFAACSGGGCGDCNDCGGCGGCGGGFESRPYPPELYPQTVITSGQVRVTPTGLSFIEDNIAALVDGALPGGLNFCLPAQTSSPEVCNDGTMCSAGGPGCDITLEITGASVTPAPPDTLDIQVNVGGLDEQIPVTIEVLGLPVSCTIQPHLRGDRNQPAVIGAEIPVTFSVDGASPTGDVKIDVGDVNLNTDNLDFRISGGIGCGLTNLVARINFVRNLILSQIQGPLQDAVDGIVNEQLCRQCDMNGQCPAGSTCNGDNICEYGSGECVPAPLGMEGRFLLGDALSDFTEHPEAALDLLIKVADEATVNDGVTLGIRSGYQPDKVENCAPVDPTARPDFNAIPLSPSIVGNVKPDGQPFMFGVGYHKKAIQHALWSVWAGGATCLNIGSDFVAQLNSTAFLGFLPSLRGLFRGGSDTRLKIVPQRAPDVILGANTVMAVGESYQITDPLMTIDWKDLDIHIYIYGTDRYVRIARLRVDVIVPVAIVPDGMGQIVPVIGDLGEAIQNVRPLDSEIAADDPQALADIIPTLVGVALPSLAGNLVDPIEVPEFFGLRLDIAPEDITSVDNNEMIAIYANLAPATMALVQAPRLAIAEERVDYSNVLASGVVRPALELDMLGFGTSDPLVGDSDIEYSYRIDNGWWSLYQRRDTLRIDDPTLAMPGRHTVHVRARYRGATHATSEPVSTDVWIDWDAPFIEDVSFVSDRLVIEATDAAEPTEMLEYRIRLVGEGLDGTWQSWSNSNVFAMDTTLKNLRVDVEVRDRMGHTSDMSTVVRRAALKSESTVTSSSPEEPKAGCSSTGERTPPVSLVLLALVGFGLLFTRRAKSSRMVRIGLLASLIAFSGCDCGDDESDTNNDGPCASCPSGTYCADDECVPGCDSADDCVAGETCVDNQCVTECEATCDASCKDGEFGVCDDDGNCSCTTYCQAGCGDDQYCCHTSDSCQTLPDPCTDTVCDPGFEPAASVDASAEEATCEVTPGTCECVPLPPLAFGFGGAYLDVATNGTTTALAAYNMTYEDLMIGVADTGNAVSWYFADGVPATGTINGALDGPRGGMFTKGEDVGKYTSVVVDASDVIHVFYRDVDGDALKYARGTATDSAIDLEFTVLEDTGGSPYWTDAVLDDTGAIHLVWGADNIDDGSGGFESQIRYATFAASDDLASIALTVETLATGPSSNPCGEKCSGNFECVPSAALCAEDTEDCAAACAEGTQCYNGSCETIWDSGVNKRISSIGQHLELSATPDGLLLTYYDHTQESAAWMRHTGTWSMPSFVGTPSGPFATGFVDANNKVHVAYMNTQDHTLVYENVTDGIVETVNNGIRDLADSWLITDIGQDVAMRVDGDGSVYMIFQDATLHTLHAATRGTDGTWTTTDLLARDPFTGSHGFYATLWQISDSSLIGNWTINQQVDPAETAAGVLR